MTANTPICWYCGYDLSGQPDLATQRPRCPECGAEDAIVGPRKPVHPPRPPSRFIVERAILSCIGASIAAQFAAAGAPITLCLAFFVCALLSARSALVRCTRRERIALLVGHLVFVIILAWYFVVHSGPARGR